MSFTSEIKKELTSLPSSTGTLLALIRMNGSLGLSSAGLTLSIVTENASTAKHIYKMLQDLYEVRAEIQVHQKTNLSKNRVYTIVIQDEVSELLDEMSLADSLMLESSIPELVMLDENIQRDYLRGAFLSAGSISDSDKGSYSLEISNVYQEHAENLKELLMNFELTSKISEHKNKSVVYLTRAEQIADFLTLIGAMQARLKFEDIKIIREMRGLANRQSNFESANIGKTVSAAQEVIHAIERLKEKSSLPSNLLEIANLRVQHPEATIKELGEMLEPALGKSGVNHRLRKIIGLAKDLG